MNPSPQRIRQLLERYPNEPTWLVVKMARDELTPQPFVIETEEQKTARVMRAKWHGARLHSVYDEPSVKPLSPGKQQRLAESCVMALDVDELPPELDAWEMRCWCMDDGAVTLPIMVDDGDAFYFEATALALGGASRDMLPSTVMLRRERSTLLRGRQSREGRDTFNYDDRWAREEDYALLRDITRDQGLTCLRTGPQRW